MILTLNEAQESDKDITQEDLDAFESAVRQMTNNNFQIQHIRFTNIEIKEPNLIILKDQPKGIRLGDTLEINYSQFNDGLYVIEELSEKEIKVSQELFFNENSKDMIATLVRYPADVKRGIKKLIQYDKKMGDKVGIKSETVSRMSKTYYDVNATDNTEGYPKALLSFLDKYEKIRWGS